MVQLKFNDNDLCKYIKIMGINKSILPPRTNMSKSIPAINGERYIGFKYEPRIISVKYILIGENAEDYKKSFRELSTLLDVKNPSKLVLPYEEDRYYYAVIEGNTDIDRIVHLGKGTLNFICHDPFAYSIDYTSKQIIMGTDTVINKGNVDTYPIVSLNFKQPSCMVKMYKSDGGTILVGIPNDVTLPTVPKTNIVIDDTCQESSNFTSSGNVLDANNKLIDGTFTVGSNGGCIICNNYGTPTNNYWNGTAFRRNIGTNLDEFEVAVNVAFSSNGKLLTLPNESEVCVCVSKTGAFIRESSNPNSNVITSVPYMGLVKTTGQYASDGMASVRYGWAGGWMEHKYLNRAILKHPSSDAGGGDGTTENQMGSIECHGFDNAGNRMFKFQIADTSEFFEFVKPKIEIGGKGYLSENVQTPTPNQIKVKDENGNVVSYQSISSGAYGEWNDCYATFRIRRKKLSDGQYRWWGEICRTRDGVNINKRIHMGSGIVNSSLPTGKLNNLIFYIAGYSEYPVASEMAINHITVKDISNENAGATGEDGEQIQNIQLFEAGDRLEIDFDEGTVLLNGQNAISYLDIGSQFFPLKPNTNNIRVISDDLTADVSIGYRERFL